MTSPPQLGGVGELHHIGVAVPSIEDAQELYLNLGFQFESAVFSDPDIDVKVQFLINAGFRIELVEPISESSPARVWLREGSPIYHFAYLVDDVEVATVKLKSQKFRKIFGPIPAIAFDNREVAFFMNRNRLVIEIIEK